MQKRLLQFYGPLWLPWEGILAYTEHAQPTLGGAGTQLCGNVFLCCLLVARRVYGACSYGVYMDARASHMTTPLCFVECAV